MAALSACFSLCIGLDRAWAIAC